MTTPTNPVVARDDLKVMLKQSRETAGLNQPEVGAQLGWPRERVGRIENGVIPASEDDLRRMLEVYRADDAQVREVLEVAAVAQQEGWFRYRDVLGLEYIRYLGYEAIASQMRQYHLSLIPGLLQTKQYMKEIFTRVNEDAAKHVRRLTAARLERQELLHAEQAPEFFIVIDEAAIRRPVGSSLLMKEQLQHLKNAAAWPNVHLFVLPFAAGANPGMKGPFNLLHFAESRRPDYLYMETVRSDRVESEGEALAAEYRQIFEDLVEMSQTGEAFDALIDDALAGVR